MMVRIWVVDGVGLLPVVVGVTDDDVVNGSAAAVVAAADTVGVLTANDKERCNVSCFSVMAFSSLFPVVGVNRLSICNGLRDAFGVKALGVVAVALGEGVMAGGLG